MIETAKWQKDKCSRACPKIHDPVCDTKGKTHENPCLFKEESCRARQNGDKIAIAKYGKCSGELVFVCFSVCCAHCYLIVGTSSLICFISFLKDQKPG